MLYKARCIKSPKCSVLCCRFWQPACVYRLPVSTYGSGVNSLVTG